jgi:hypothetical protein
MVVKPESRSTATIAEACRLSPDEEVAARLKLSTGQRQAVRPTSNAARQQDDTGMSNMTAASADTVPGNYATYAATDFIPARPKKGMFDLPPSSSSSSLANRNRKLAWKGQAVAAKVAAHALKQGLHEGKAIAGRSDLGEWLKARGCKFRRSCTPHGARPGHRSKQRTGE